MAIGIRIVEERYLIIVCSVILVENFNKLISNYLPLSLSVLLFLSFYADKDNQPPDGRACFSTSYLFIFKGKCENSHKQRSRFNKGFTSPKEIELKR